jgi:hypothetical protein
MYKGRYTGRVRLRDLRSGLAEAKSHLAKEPLTLPHPKGYTVMRVQMLGQQLTIPQTGRVAELGGTAPEILAQQHPLACVNRLRTARAFAFSQSIQTLRLERIDPTLHRTPIFAEQFRNLLTALSRSNQQQTMQAMVISSFLGPDNFLLNGDSHNVGVSNLQSSHDSLSHVESYCHYNSFMRHDLCRYV